MRGKDKCRILKQIRQQIADANDIEYITRECTYQGDCRGTCPKCEAELRYLEEQLELRRSRGKKIAVAAIAAGIMMTSATGCDFSSDGDETKGLLPEPSPTAIAEEPMGAPPAEEEVVIGEVAAEDLVIEGDVPYENLDGEDGCSVVEIDGEVAEEYLIEELEGDVAYVDPEDSEIMGAEATPDEMAEFRESGIIGDTE